MLQNSLEVPQRCSSDEFLQDTFSQRKNDKISDFDVKKKMPFPGAMFYALLHLLVYMTILFILISQKLNI